MSGLRLAGAILLTGLVLGGCTLSSLVDGEIRGQPPALPGAASAADVYPTPALGSLVREQREVPIPSSGVTLAGELDLPDRDQPPLVFIIHHSGPVPRDAYGYMADLLVEAGFAVFRFDKRGTGASQGDYGCCEAEDAVAAYRVAATQQGFDPGRVFIVAQSIGTEILAEHFAEFAEIQPPAGVVLLSSLLGPDRIVAIDAPVHIIISDSEANLAAIGEQAVAAHQQHVSAGASLYVAAKSEHTLFDITDGPIDWSDPGWVNRYHRGAMRDMIAWLRSFDEVPGGDLP